jgi:dTDP-glucose 4,6-dehydratase
LVEAARRIWTNRNISGRWLQVSTDEVYGSLEPGRESLESDSLEPSSPYSASKAAADLWLKAYGKTYGFPAMVTRCCNNFGPYQFREKLIPRMVRCALEGEPLPIYGDGQQVREWIHVSDHCRGLIEVMERGSIGETYHLGSGVRVSNRDLVDSLLACLKSWSMRQGIELSQPLVQHVEDRWGHDRLYALNSEKTQDALDWACQVPFDRGFRETIEWLAEDFLPSTPG